MKSKGRPKTGQAPPKVSPEPLTLAADASRLWPGLKEGARRLLAAEGREGRILPTELALSALRRQKRASQPWSTLRWRNESHFRAAAYRAMTRALKDKFRAAGRRPDRVGAGNLASEYLAPLIQDGALDLSDLIHGDGPETGACSELADALEELRRRHPEVAETLYLVHWKGFTHEETARTTGVSVRTVHTWLRLGYALLLERLGGGEVAPQPSTRRKPSTRTPRS